MVKKLVHPFVFFTLVLGIVLTMAFLPADLSASGPCYNGTWIGNDNGHHFVAFEGVYLNSYWEIVNKPWAVTVAESVTGKTMNVWSQPDIYGRLKAGFPWPDHFAPWYYFFSPSNFTVCVR